MVTEASLSRFHSFAVQWPSVLARVTSNAHGELVGSDP